jgi:hypothetical protein
MGRKFCYSPIEEARIMSKRMGWRTFLNLGMVLGIVALVSACGWTRTGKLRRESEVVPLKEAESVDVDIRMGAGTLEVIGGAASDALMEAEFAYNVVDWKPTLDYVVSSGGDGDLVIQQPGVKSVALNSYCNEWALAFNDGVLMDLSLALGAGESTLDLASLSLTALDVKMGVGGVDLDLTGDYEQDLDVTLRGGLGEATVLLPADIGVLARVDGALGDLDVSGMTREGDAYVNEAYGESDVTLTVDIQAGVGGLDLQVVE